MSVSTKKLPPVNIDDEVKGISGPYKGYMGKFIQLMVRVTLSSGRASLLLLSLFLDLNLN